VSRRRNPADLQEAPAARLRFARGGSRPSASASSRARAFQAFAGAWAEGPRLAPSNAGHGPTFDEAAASHQGQPHAIERPGRPRPRCGASATNSDAARPSRWPKSECRGQSTWSAAHPSGRTPNAPRAPRRATRGRSRSILSEGPPKLAGFTKLPAPEAGSGLCCGAESGAPIVSCGPPLLECTRRDHRALKTAPGCPPPPLRSVTSSKPLPEPGAPGPLGWRLRPDRRGPPPRPPCPSRRQRRLRRSHVKEDVALP